MGHWYQHDGSPMHFVKKANGKGMRDTTIRDARKHRLLPSVTTLLGILDKPGLTNWKIKEAVLTARVAHRKPKETDWAYAFRMMRTAKQHAERAADEGSRIHDAIECHLKGRIFPERYEPHVEATMDLLDHLVPDFVSQRRLVEVRLADPLLGSAGMVDLMLPDINFVIDYKTKDMGDEKADMVKAYDEQGMQLAAYAGMAQLPMEHTRLINIFVSRTEPGVVTHFTHDNPVRLWRGFQAICDYWHAMNEGLR